ESLRDGEPLRWVANHQGGYPAEFYPVGIAWLDVGLWALLLGSLPIIAVHKLTVILIFVLPALAYWIMARGDHLTLWIAFLATTIHIAIPGDWTNGGYRELVDWGLVTNVGGATLALIASAALARVFHNHDWSLAAPAALAIAAAAYTNPRSLLAIVVATLALLLTAWVFPIARSGAVRRTSLIAVAAIAGASVLLAGPLLIPLVRYRNLYSFVHYEGYATPRAYWESTVTAVSLPVVFLSVAGLILTFTVQRHAIARSIGIALVGYLSLTGGLSDWAATGGLIEQLETPRLMPFQRLMMIYLAAYAIVWFIESVVRMTRAAHARAVTSGAIGVAGIAVVAGMFGSVWSVPEVFVTPPVESTARPEFAEYRTAIQAANQILPPGTAILVLGNRLDSERWWHEQLWAPLESDAPFFYDDWLWYWHLDHAGPYNAASGHAYPDPARALASPYLEAHGIGSVVVTNMNVRSGGDPREAAASDPSLILERTVGAWDVFRVGAPTPIVTNGMTEPSTLTVKNHSIEVGFTDASGTVTVRRNWFPRWRATADGNDVAVTRTSDGYMEVTVPPGTRSLKFEYEVTGADWAARIGAGAGLLAVVGMAISSAGIWRWQGPRRRRQPHVPLAQAGETGSTP
ncbi:MAG: hypothetical protein H0W23_05275, partial [Chloroflexia bacterium]|nr:hypothetical protein [Chloroflexia bacterium]